MGFWEAIVKSAILGTVQGLTEFLPVSSSGHLTLLQRALGYGVGGRGMTFVNVLLHFGTLLAVAAFFFREILSLFRRPFKPLLVLALATLPAGALGLLLGDELDALFDPDSNVYWLCFLALFFSLTALLLLAAERTSRRRRGFKAIGYKQGIAMGFAQAVALLPGISRSGATIAAGVLAGAKREEVAKFSFLMSIPVILGSLLLEGIGLFEGEPPAFTANELAGMAVGLFCSAVSGYVAIRIMQRVVGRGNYRPFAYYLFLLSLTCLWLNVLDIL